MPATFPGNAVPPGRRPGPRPARAGWIARRPARAARPAGQAEPASISTPAPAAGAGRADRQLRAGLPHAGRSARGGRPGAGRPRRRSTCTASAAQPTDEFGRNCLVARRLVERGVRFVQLYSGGGHLEDTWDAHESVEKNHGRTRAEVDQPIAALLTDLERRGLLDSTLVVLGRRVRPHAVCRRRGRAGPQPQPLRLHDVAGRRRRERGHLVRRDRRVRLRGRRRTRPICTTSTPRSWHCWASTTSASPTSIKDATSA